LTCGRVSYHAPIGLETHFPGTREVCSTSLPVE
jgi:hypothetical protein